MPAAGADALLDIDARMVGYATYNITDPDFRPYLMADVCLVPVKTRAVLYSEQIMLQRAHGGQAARARGHA